MKLCFIAVAAKKQRKSEVLAGILETMETDGGVEDWQSVKNKPLMYGDSVCV